MLLQRRLMLMRVSKLDEKRGLDVTEHGIGIATARAPPKAAGPRSRLLARFLASRTRRRAAAAGQAPPAVGRAHGGEFVEDVRHAADVSGLVRTFALKLRRRAVERREAAAQLEQQGPVDDALGAERSASDELAAVFTLAVSP